MAAEQLCFFKFQRPLLERFGKEFFSEVPRQPGVYLFTGERDRPLYVGHSRDLRTRLSYYKNAQPEREPRRIVRLVHQVRKIEMECHDSVESAQLRELALIRQLRPRFNVANTLSPTYSFFGFRPIPGGFALRLSMSEAWCDSEKRVGAFRNRGLCARAFMAIARTIVAHSGAVQSAFDFPTWLNVRAQEWRFDEKWRESIHSFISGASDSVFFVTKKLTECTGDPFLRQIFETDLLTLAEFFQLAREMAALRLTLESAVISQEALQVSQKLVRKNRVYAESSLTEPFQAGRIALFD